MTYTVEEFESAFGRASDGAVDFPTGRVMVNHSPVKRRTGPGQRALDRNRELEAQVAELGYELLSVYANRDYWQGQAELLEGLLGKYIGHVKWCADEAEDSAFVSASWAVYGIMADDYPGGFTPAEWSELERLAE